MAEAQNHSIAKYTWDTTFDTREKSWELQNKLSHWSKYHMPTQFDRIFNALCPEGHTVKIKRLELDLGVINYTDFHHHLPSHLEAKLREQLLDLIHNPGKSGHLIEIEPQYASFSKMLKDFLQKGIMPWNHHPEMGSADDIFEKLMDHDGYGLLQMLLPIVPNETVRKRLAWQFKEGNVKRLITLLEPNNHPYIFQVVNELTTIQEKENIVSSGAMDFKKNLWYWVLTYLFQKRDSLFNKVSFVKSKLLAMSNHFNMEYGQLLSGISKALEHINKGAYKTVELLTVLHMITKEHRQKAGIAIIGPNPKNPWKNLEFLSSKLNKTATPAQEREFNALIQLLAKKDSTRLKHLIFGHEGKEQAWSNKLGSLTSLSKETLVSTLLGQNAGALINDLAFIRGLGLEKALGIPHDKLWEIAYSFVLTLHSKPYETDSFLNYLISKLGDLNHGKHVDVLEKLLRDDVPVMQKRQSNLSIFRTWNAQLHSAKAGNEINSFPGQSKNISENWDDLMMYPSLEDNERKLLKNALTDKEASWVIALRAMTIAIQKISRQLPESSAQLRILGHWVMPLGVQVSLRSTNLDTFQFLIQLLEALQRQFCTDHNMDLGRYFRKILIHPQLKTLEISEQQLSTLRAHAAKIGMRDPWETLDHIIQHEPGKQKQVSDILAVLVHERKIEDSNFKGLTPKLLRYLLPQGEKVQQGLTEYFAKKIAAEQTEYTSQEILQFLKNWFWQCLADYSAHKGDKDKFKHLFQSLVLSGFPMDHLKGSWLPLNTVPETPMLNEQPKTTASATVRLFQLLKEKENATTTVEKSKELKKLLVRALEESPSSVRLALLKHDATSEDVIKALRDLISIHQFIALSAQDMGYANHSIIKSIHALYGLILKSGLSVNYNHLETLFWNYTMAIYTSKESAKAALHYLLEDCMQELTKHHHDSDTVILVQIQTSQIALPSPLKTVFTAYSEKFLPLKQVPDTPNAIIDIKWYEEEYGKIDDLITTIIVEGKIPSWFQHLKKYSIQTLLAEILHFYPLAVLRVLRSIKVSDFQFIKLCNLLDFSQFIHTLIQLYPGNASQLKDLEKLYFSIGPISNSAVPSALLQEILVLKIINAWKTQQWNLIAAKSLWRELFWEVCAKNEIPEALFFKAITSIKTSMPPALVISYNTFYKNNTATALSEKNKKVLKEKFKDKQLPTTDTIPVPNAGVVLLNGYIQMLLERLELVADKKFVSDEAQEAAVHYVQHAVTGLTHTHEHLLPLNKVLCGLALDTPVKDGIEISENHKSLIEGLITSCIGYWPAIGSCSIDGFRGNWLVRNGLLEETETNWNLSVESRPYDILLSKAPFSFSIIKLPWMQKPLHVKWSY